MRTKCVTRITFAINLIAILGASIISRAAEKPKVAVFPLGGDAPSDLRERIGFSLRTKLDRDGTYEPIDGPAMQDIASAAKEPLSFDTPVDQVTDLAADAKPAVLIWGQVDEKNKLDRLRLKILDLRQADAQPRVFEKEINDPIAVRFAVEEALKTIRGVKDLEHPNEIAVRHDPAADAAWAKNPNLVVNGDFSAEGHWEGLYQSEDYPVRFSDDPPATDKVVIYRMPAEKGGAPQSVLAMNLSKTAAENNGLACLSEPIKIQPRMRYRLSFRYKSDGPSLHVFVKGYTTAKNIKGESAEREVYRRQVPPSGATDGQWVTVVDDLNPQHVAFPVEHLRIDLYAYLKPGIVMFDDVQLKAIGPQRPEDKASDDAIKPPTTRE